VEDYMGFLQKLKGKARYTIFHIPLNLSVQTVFRKNRLIYARKKVGHIHYYTKETALATLEDTGYRIIDHFYTAGSIDLPDKKLRTRLAKFPRKFFFKLNEDLTVRVLGGYSLMVLAENLTEKN
jgi:hypothetical protein